VKIASWNVNSIRVRKERLLRWLERHSPDVLCLQELKAPDEHFPMEEVRAAGYHAAVLGQRTYNGVAILSRLAPEGIERGLQDDVGDAEARLIGARIAGVRVISLYVPNGQVVGSEKWAYRQSWMRRLRGLLERRCDPKEPLALCGDWNVAPEDRDVCDPAGWAESVLFHPDARAAFDEVRSWGLVDTFRLHHQEAGRYSWWDYRMLAFPKNQGLRIDHVLATHPLADRCTGAGIDRDERKGQQPSDHVPVWAEFAPDHS
jgi:exodeoxyribonuclease III